jgi:hypothetical protein
MALRMNEVAHNIKAETARNNYETSRSPAAG